MTPVTTRSLNSIGTDTVSMAAGEDGQSAVSDGFGSILRANNVFRAFADADKGGDSRQNQLIEEAHIEIPVDYGTAPLNAATLQDVLVTGLAPLQDFGHEATEGAEQVELGSPTLLLLKPGEVSDQRVSGDSAIHITNLVLADTQATNKVMQPGIKASRLPEGTVKQPAEDSLNTLLSPLSGLEERSMSVLNRAFSGPVLTADDPAAAGLLLLSGLTSGRLPDTDQPESLCGFENDVDQSPVDGRSGAQFASRVSRPLQADDDGFGDDQENITGLSDGAVFQTLEAVFLSGLMLSQLPKSGDTAGTTEPLVHTMAVNKAWADTMPAEGVAETSIKESVAPPEMIRSKDLFTSITVEQKQDSVSAVPIVKDKSPSIFASVDGVNALIHAVNEPLYVVNASAAPAPASSAIGPHLALADNDDGTGEQAVILTAKPFSIKTAKTTISGEDKQSGLDAAGGSSSGSSRAGVSPFASAQERRPDRQSDVVTDSKVSAADNALPTQALPTPAQQIISGLREQYSRLETAQPQGRQIAEAEPDPLAKGGIKILRIRLQPETLGEVEVTIRRSGGEVKVGLAVGSEATAATLRQDLGTLQDRLISSLLGETTPIIEISVRDLAVQTQGQYPSGTGAGSSYGLTGGNDTGSERRPSSDGEANAFSSEKSDDDEQVDHDSRSYAGLVV